MALVLADRVNETTTTAGIGTLTLAGAVSGYQSFSVIGNANTTYYTIVGQTTGEWEVGIGTYTSAGTTLSRDTVLASSAGGTTKVTLSAGTKFVFCDYPAGRAVYLDTASNATIPGITLSGGTANGVAYLNGSKVLTTGSALTFDGTTLTTTNVKLVSSGSIVDGGGNAVLTPTSGGSVALTSNGAYTNGNIVYNALAATGVHVFSVNSAEKMRLDSSGNLLVGSTTKDFEGSIYLKRTSGVAAIDVFTASTSEAKVQLLNNNNSAAIGNGSGGEIVFYANTRSTERARIDGSGNLLVGTTSASFNSSNSTFFYPTTGYWVVNHANGTSTGTRYIGFGYNTGEIGSITQSGTTGVLYNITSDYRLKEFVAPVTNAGERIDALNPVEFDWKSDGSRARGFFAHEFQQVYANSVTGEKDGVDADGNPVYQTMQASTAEVIADLVAEIKSLRQRVAQLEVK